MEIRSDPPAGMFSAYPWSSNERSLMLRLISESGIKSDHLFAAGFVSIAASFLSWAVSRAKADDPKSQSDRWGLFVGEWAPTFFALGVGLKLEENEQNSAVSGLTRKKK